MAGQREKQLETVDFNSKQLLFEKPEKASLPLLLLVQSWCMKKSLSTTGEQRPRGGQEPPVIRKDQGEELVLWQRRRALLT